MHLKTNFFNYSPFVSASGKTHIPMLPELDLPCWSLFLGPDPGVNTHGWAGVTLSLLQPEAARLLF